MDLEEYHTENVQYTGNGNVGVVSPERIECARRPIKEISLESAFDLVDF